LCFVGLALAGMGVALRIEAGFELGASDDVSTSFFGFSAVVFVCAALRAVFRHFFPPPEDD